MTWASTKSSFLDLNGCAFKGNNWLTRKQHPKTSGALWAATWFLGETVAQVVISCQKKPKMACMSIFVFGLFNYLDSHLFDSFQTERMNLIKEQNAVHRPLHRNAHVWQQKSLFQSLTESWCCLSALGSLQMIDSSIFIEAIQQKGRKREANPAHWAEGAWRPVEIKKINKSKINRLKGKQEKHGTSFRFSLTLGNTDPQQLIIGLIVYHSQSKVYLPCRHFNRLPYVV